MERKHIALLAINAVLAIGAFTLVGLGKIEWVTAEAFVLGQLVPSVWGALKQGESK